MIVLMMYKCALTTVIHLLVALLGIKSPSRLTSVPFMTNVATVVEYRRKKLQTYMTVCFCDSVIFVLIYFLVLVLVLF